MQPFRFISAWRQTGVLSPPLQRPSLDTWEATSVLRVALLLTVRNAWLCVCLCARAQGLLWLKSGVLAVTASYGHLLWINKCSIQTARQEPLCFLMWTVWCFNGLLQRAAHNITLKPKEVILKMFIMCLLPLFLKFIEWFWSTNKFTLDERWNDEKTHSLI